MKHKWLSVLLVLALALSFVPAAVAQNGVDRPLPASVDGLKMAAPVEDVAAARVSPQVQGLQGPVRISVRLSKQPTSGVSSDQRLQLRAVKLEQTNFIKSARNLDANLKVLGATQRVLNAVMLLVDGSQVEAIAQLPGVQKVSPIYDYQLDLSETVPYIGGTAVQNMGYTGAGVRVAVLDSGIDYTHANLGGSGNPADHAANNPNVIEPGSFPTAKVVGGYDFVGSNWPNTVEQPDPDPLDAGPGAGHGTHVSDIIGGVNGVAPGVSLYGVKVCSSVSSSCSGVALLEGMDFAADPNGDGKTWDAVDLINMSLGSLYGQAWDDDLSAAVYNATQAGILVVASAGNSGDKPFITGTPAASPAALSVAQTEVPSAFLQLFDVLTPASIAGTYGAVWQNWSPLVTSTLTGPLQYGDGAGGNKLGCSAFPAGSLTGKIVLVDRGSCAGSIKISNIAAGGALVGIIGLVAPGDPFSFSFGGGTPTIPGFMISQSDSNILKSGLAAGVTIEFDPANVQNLVGHVVGSSSRGPSNFGGYVKPEIGAPGASVSAIYGTGTGEGPFGGTSGAAPMVTGSAALLLDAEEDLNPFELKARLVTNAETEIINKSVYLGDGELAGITRIGGGEVRVDRAVNQKVAMWELAPQFPSLKFPNLSFGAVDASSGHVVLAKNVTVHNYDTWAKTFEVIPSFRFQNDADTGAVNVWVNNQSTTFVDVPAASVLPDGTVVAGQAPFNVKLEIHSSALRNWYLDSGPLGDSGSTLRVLEYDGYIWLDDVNTTDDDATMTHIPWHVLPRLSGDVAADSDTFSAADMEVDLTNNGAGAAFVDVYSLLAISPQDYPIAPEYAPGINVALIDLRQVGAASFAVPAGYCSANASYVIQFVANTWNRYAHGWLPAGFEYDIDINGDDVADYFVYDWTAGATDDGRSVVYVQKASTGAVTAWFYNDQITNSNTETFTFCLEQLGLSPATAGTWSIDVLAWDNYFTGYVTDVVENVPFTPGQDRFVGGIDWWGGGDLASGETKTLQIFDTGGSNPDLGVLLKPTSARFDGSNVIYSGAPGLESLGLEYVP